jgi:hypothetical protein
MDLLKNFSDISDSFKGNEEVAFFVLASDDPSSTEARLIIHGDGGRLFSLFLNAMICDKQFRHILLAVVSSYSSLHSGFGDSVKKKSS